MPELRTGVGEAPAAARCALVAGETLDDNVAPKEDRLADENIRSAERLYACFAAGDIPGILAIFDDQLRWQEAEGNPYQPDGQAWSGVQPVLALFGRLATEWEAFAVNMTSLTPIPDGVLAEGRYTGRYRATGRDLDAQVAHVLTMRGGKVVHFKQYVDTAQMQAVMGSRDVTADS